MNQAIREKGWYWVRKEGWRGEHGDWQPAEWRPNAKAWYSADFGGIRDCRMIIGERLVYSAPQETTS